MPRSLWSRLVEQALGPVGRASRLDQDERHAQPGWPTGVIVQPAAMPLRVIEGGLAGAPPVRHRPRRSMHTR